MRQKNPEKKFRIEKILSERADRGRHEFILVLDGLKSTYNVGKIFRSAQAFGAREVWLVRIPYFDPYPAKGAFKQTRSRSFGSFEECYAALKSEDYALFAMDPSGGLELDRATLPHKSAFVMGHEEFGLSFDLSSYPDVQKLKIRQWGHVQSLNVSVAASLAMYEHCRQWA